MDQNLKHRLTGAIILVSLAVIFIPVILEGPDNEWTPLSHSIPEAPQLDYEARIDLPRPTEAPVHVKPARKIVPQPERELAVPARKETRNPAPAPESAAGRKPATGAAGGWYVQVGSFAQELNASGLGKRLELSGFDTRLQQAATGTGYAWRVMVGPSKSRETAEKVRDRLVRELQLEGLVLNHPG